MTALDWVRNYDRNGRLYMRAETPLGTCTLRLRKSAGNFQTYQATLADGRRIATADTLEELKVAAEFHVARLANADPAP